MREIKRITHQGLARRASKWPYWSDRLTASFDLLGNAKLLEVFEIAAAPLEAEAKRLPAKGRTSMFVAVDGKAADLVSVSDPSKNRHRGQ